MTAIAAELLAEVYVGPGNEAYALELVFVASQGVLAVCIFSFFFFIFIFLFFTRAGIRGVAGRPCGVCMCVCECVREKGSVCVTERA